MDMIWTFSYSTIPLMGGDLQDISAKESVEVASNKPCNIRALTLGSSSTSACEARTRVAFSDSFRGTVKGRCGDGEVMLAVNDRKFKTYSALARL